VFLTSCAGGPVHTTLVEFENAGFSPKTYQTFSVHATSEKFKNATVMDHFDLCLKTRSRESHDQRDAIVFEKLRFPNVFRPLKNAKEAFSNSSGFKSVFEKLRFRDGLV